MGRGTRVANGYVAVTADGSGINDEINDAFEDSVDGAGDAGDRAGQRFGDRMGERIGQRLGPAMEKVSARLGKRLSKDIGESVSDGVGDGLDDAVSEAKRKGVGARLGDAVGAKVSVLLRRKVSDGIKEGVDEVERRGIGARLGDRIGDRIGGQIADRIEEALGSIEDRIATAMEKGGGGGRGGGPKNPTVAGGGDDPNRLGNRIGAALGKGSRNNFFNIIGSSVGGLVNLIDNVRRGAVGLFRTFGVGWKAVGEGASLFKKALGGLGAVGGSILPTLAAVGPKIAAGLSVGIAVAGLLTSILSGLAGTVVALASTIATSLVGALAVGGGLMTALVAAGGLATIMFANMSKAQKKVMSANFKPLGKQVADLGESMAKGFVPYTRFMSENLQRFITLITPLGQKMGVVFGQVGAVITGMLSGPGFQKLIASLGVYLPSIVKNLGYAFGDWLNGMAGLFAAVMPYVDRFVKYLADVAARFSEWANSAKGQNSIATFMDRAVASAKSLWGFLKQVGGLLGDLLFNPEGQKSGNDLFGSMTEAVKTFRAYIADGRLAQWFVDTKEFAYDLGAAIEGVAKALAFLDDSVLMDIAGGILKTIGTALGLIPGQAASAIGVLIGAGGLLWALKRVGGALGVIKGAGAVSRGAGAAGAAGLLGKVVGSAKPVPVFVTNPGFGIPGKGVPPVVGGAPGAAAKGAAAKGGRLAAAGGLAARGGIAALGVDFVVRALGGNGVIKEFNDVANSITRARDANKEVGASFADVRRSLEASNVGKYAKDLGLDMNRLAADIAKNGDKGKYLDKVMRDLSSGGLKGAAAGLADFLTPGWDSRVKLAGRAVQDLEKISRSAGGGLTTAANAAGSMASRLAQNASGVRAYSTVLRGMPAKVITTVAARGTDLTRANVRSLQRQYDLTPKQVRTLMGLVGDGPTRKRVQAVRQAIQDANKARAFPVVGEKGSAATKGKVDKVSKSVGSLGRMKAIPGISERGSRGVLSAISNVFRRLTGLDGKKATTIIETVYSTVGSAVRGIGKRLGFDSGGTVPGLRFPYGDKVLAALAPGEEVITNKNGEADRFRRDRAQGVIPAYANGGMVQRLASGGTAKNPYYKSSAQLSAAAKKKAANQPNPYYKSSAELSAKARAAAYAKVKVKAKAPKVKVPALDMSDFNSSIQDGFAEIVKAVGKDAVNDIAGPILGEALKMSNRERMKSYTARRTLANQQITSENRIMGLMARNYKQSAATLADYAVARERVTKRLEEANTELANAISMRDSYNTSVIDAVNSFGSIIATQARVVNGVEQTLSSGDILTSLTDRLASAKKYQSDLRMLLAQGLSDNAYKQLVDAGVEQGGKFADTILGGGVDAVQKTNELTAAIDKVAGELGFSASDRLYQSGINMTQGLIAGLTSQSAELDKAAQVLGDKIAYSVRKSLGIKSPSRVARDIADNFTGTLIAGLNKGQAPVANAAAGLLANIAPSAEVTAYAARQGQSVSGNQDSRFRDLIIQTPTADPEAVARETLNEITGRL